jgi:hypothetical protein
MIQAVYGNVNIFRAVYDINASFGFRPIKGKRIIPIRTARGKARNVFQSVVNVPFAHNESAVDSHPETSADLVYDLVILGNMPSRDA